MAEKTRNITILPFDTNSTAILPSIAISKKKFKYFFKKFQLFLFKNTQILKVLRNLTISVAFYRESATILQKKTRLKT